MAKMTQEEIEYCSITGMFKGLPLRSVNPFVLKSNDEIQDFFTIVMLHNAEALDEIQDTRLAKMMLRKIGILC